MTIIPEPLKHEHDALHADLVKATQAGGATAAAAKKVAHLLHPHFVQEEAFAMPPLARSPCSQEANCPLTPPPSWPWPSA